MAKQRVAGSAEIEVRATAEKIASDVAKIKQLTRTQLEGVEKSIGKIKPNIETGLLKKTISEIRTMHSVLQKQLEQKIKLNADYASIQRTKQALDTVKDALRNVELEGSKLTSSGNFDFGKVVKWAAIATAAKAMASFTFEAVKMGAAEENLRASFKGTDEDIEKLRKATARTVADADLLELSNQASALGITLEQQVILFSLAEDAGDAMGKDVSAGMEKIIAASEGMGRGLKSLGIQTKVYEQFVKDGAAAHGTTIEKLDAETQKQVRLEAIIRASGLTLADVNKKVQDHADKIESAGKSWANLKSELGKGLAPFFAGIFDFASKTLDKLKEIAGLIKLPGIDRKAYTDQIVKMEPKKLAEEQETINKSVADYTNKVKDAKEALAKLRSVEYPNKDKIEEKKKDIELYNIELNKLHEKQSLLINIGNLKEPKNDKPTVVTDPEEAKKKGAEKLELEKKFYESLKFLSANFIEYKLKETEKEIEEMKKAGLKELDFEAYKTAKKKQLFDEYLAYVSKETGFTFDKNGQVSNGKEAIPLELMGKNKLKGAREERKPNIDFGTDAQILEDWVNQSEASQMAFNTMFDAFYEGLSQIKIRTKESASSIEKTFASMANILIAEIERILLKWALLNIIALATKVPGVGLAAAAGLPTKNITTAGLGSGGSSATNISMPAIAMSYQNNFSNSSSFNDRNIVQRLDAVVSRVEALTVATIKGRGRVTDLNTSDIIKKLAYMVTQEQNNFSADNIKVSRG